MTPLHDTVLELPAPRVVQTAPTPLRLVASLIDLVAIGLFGVLTTWLIITTDPEPPPVAPWNFIDQVVDYLNDRPGRSLLALAVLFFLNVLWPIVWKGRTPGRRLFHLELVARTDRLTASRLLLWSVCRVGLLLPAGLGLWWAIIDRDRRTLYDRLAGVWLIRTRNSTDGS